MGVSKFMVIIDSLKEQVLCEAAPLEINSELKTLFYHSLGV